MKNKYLSLTLALILLVALPPVAFSAMTDYCSAPPYVTRSIAPNIMVVMDNSEDMLQPAYEEEVYDPSADYLGFFKPTGCYEYTNSKFQEVLNTTVTPNRTYLIGETCPSSAPFRGNLMNWATMSKYDVLQKVLLGGNTTSKQGNAHTLVGIGGVWPLGRNYNGCEFRIDNGNLTVFDYETSEACDLLDSTPTAIALQESLPDSDSHQSLRGLLASYVEQATEGVEQVFGSAGSYWDSIDLISDAWAAVGCYEIQVGSLDGKMGEQFQLILTLPQNLNNKTATWTPVTMPAWLTTDAGSPEYAKFNSKLNDGIVTWFGTPPSPGLHAFEVEVTSDGCTGTKTVSGNIYIEAAALKINHFDTSLTDGTVGEDYWFSMPSAQGGIPPYSWTVTGLPAGLTLDYDTVDGVDVYNIEGTPTTAGMSTVTMILEDSSGNIVSKNVGLTVSEGLTITTNSLPVETVNFTYTSTINGASGTLPYSWSVAAGGLPPGLVLSKVDDYNAEISGTSTVAGVYTFTLQLADGAGASVTKNFTIEILSGAFVSNIIASQSPLPDAYKDIPYSYTVEVMEHPSGFSSPSWSISGQPAGMTIDPVTGEITWTPSNNADTTYTGIVVALDIIYDGTGILYHDEQTFEITSYKDVPDSNVLRSKTFAVKAVLLEEPLTDLNGNDIWDLGETYTDSDGNGQWDGKQGVFQKFWDSNNPKARWGLTKFSDIGASTEVDVNTCIPVNNSASFFTSIQNATSASSAPLADALYGAVNYYGFDSPYGLGYTGCNSSDPIDYVPCRKNFILMITSGADLTGTDFDNDSTCSEASPLVQNACYGYENDLRSTVSGKQNTYTYIVNTMGTDAAATVLETAALTGGGGYYRADGGSDIEAQLTKAIEDILAQAASGTAVSVLTTSSRGIGSMMQAYFLPVRQEGAREVRWTGYVQNLWIDPDDNLREDTGADLKLNLTQDNVLKLYFDESTNETKAALFDNDALEVCTLSDPSNDIIDFDEVNYNWEGGYKLALKDPSARDIFTTRKVIYGGTVIDTFNETEATFTTAALDTDLKTALDADATYSSDEIIRYIRGECLEASVTGDTDCGTTADADFRDRRVTIPSAEGGATNGNVWKLGDVISSTPKVLANTPNNTYHIDYGDVTYYQYVSDDSDDGYAKRSSIALVGANDGMLHAFRVGYLQDTDITESNVLGIFKNLFNDDDTDEIGDEVWAYIPYNALPYLKYLADPDYCHIYYNDLSVRITDASLGCDTDTSCDEPGEVRKKESWRTILVGGMRFGGGCNGGVPTPPGTVTDVGYSSYYAIDITDSENPVPLWEFSDPDMGYATGFPSILRTGASSTNGNWYVAFGSGSTTMPKSSTDMGRAAGQLGQIYILNLETGEIAKKIPLDDDEIVGDILTIDKNKDYITEKLYFGTSYKDSGVWKGKVSSLDIPNQDLADTWTPSLKTLFTGDYPFTASPDAANDEGGNTWVYAGSGKYFSDVDEDTADTQIFVGLKDLSTVTYPVTTATTGVDDKTSVTTTGTVAETTQVCGYDPDTNSFGMQTVVTRTNQTSTAATIPDIGWYVSLVDGERVISRPLAVGGLVDYLTYKPSSDACSYGGDSYLYAVGYTTGEAPAKIAIRNTQTTGDATSGSVDIAKGIRLGPGAPPTGEAIIIPPPKEAQQQLKKKIQVATGVIVEAENTPAMSITSEVVHWLKK